MVLKKVLAVLFMVSFTLLQAKGEDKLELQKTMISFASAMEIIQHGILYSDKQEMLKGAQLLKLTNAELFKQHGDAIALHMPKDPEFAKKFARRTSQKIQDYADKMTQNLDDRKAYSKMSAIYTHILQECVGCHQKIRRW